ncbi:Ubiquinone/menaquinone biosynthesis C-methyltransferase UbiE [uncultured archaeon]|nr:Ubiquinone/menaquinone biosynthesis C-methyltransferase UbiE [uncultured archaeon]
MPNIRQRKSFSDFFKRHVHAGERPAHEVEEATRNYERIEHETEHETSEHGLARKWDTLQPHYSKLFGLESMRGDAEYIFPQARFRSQDHVLSIGSGPAVLDNYIAKHFVRGGKVTCIDISPKMNDEARQLGERAQVPNISFITANAAKLPIQNSTQDKIILGYGLLATRNPEGTLNEAYRGIKKDGNSRLILLEAVEHMGMASGLLHGLALTGFEVTHKEARHTSTGIIKVCVTAKPKK